MRRSPLAPALLLACVASTSGFTATSPELVKASGEAVDALYLRAKPDMLKAAKILDEKLQPLLTLAAARFGHLLPEEKRRKLQLSALLPTGGANLDQLVQGLRSQFCGQDAIKTQIKQGAAQLITGAGISAPSLDPIVDAVWPCLCTDLSFSDPAYSTLLSATSTDSTVTSLEGVIPQLFSSTGGICTASCREAGILLTDWLIAAADSAIAIDAVKNAVPWLPALATSFSGLGSKLAKCVCDGVSWTGLVALFGSANAAATATAVAQITTAVQSFTAGTADPSTLFSAPFQSAITTMSQYPTFLLSEQAFCSTGCAEVGQMAASYGKKALEGIVAYPSYNIPAGVATAVTAFGEANIIGCFCGGTHDYEVLLNSLAGAAAATGVLPIISAVVTSVFSPTYLCSSAPCKRLTADTMAVIAAGKNLDQSLSSFLSFSDIEWCPAEGAGTTVKQTFTIAGDVASFGASQQLAFKSNLVSQLNAGITNDWSKVTVGQVALTVNPASVSVEASIATSSDTVKSSITTSMTTLASATPATLSASLGVSVEAVAAPTETVVAERQAVAVAGAGSSSSSGGAIGGAIGGASGLIFGIFGYMMYKQKQKKTVAVAGKA